jgi:hypothetical protein
VAKGKKTKPQPVRRTPPRPFSPGAAFKKAINRTLAGAAIETAPPAPLPVKDRFELHRKLAAARAGEKPLDAALARDRGEEAVVIEQCGVWLGTLMRGSPEVETILKAMVALRQGYVIAYRELLEQLGRHGETGREEHGLELPPELADYAVQYAMYEAAKPFNEHTAMQGLMDALPRLGEAIDRHAAVDDEARKAEAEETAKARADSPVPLGLKFNPHQEDTSLDRKKSLVLFGWAPAVQHVLDAICSNALGARLTVLRLMDKAPAARDQHRFLVRVGGNAWAGCANSERQLALTMGEHAADKLSAAPDLLVCDDLTKAYTLGFAGRAGAANAGDAHRRLRAWCDKGQCGLVGAVPLDAQEVPELGPEYEQLKTFAHLRPVRVEPNGDDYLITVGDAEQFVAPKETLDRAGSKILLPGPVAQRTP